MKGFYKVAAFILLGVSLGLFLGAKYLGAKTVYSGKMRLKQKGEGHIMKTDIDIAIENTRKQLKEKKKELRKAKKDERRTGN